MCVDQDADPTRWETRQRGLPEWELEPWRFDDLATDADRRDLDARAAELRGAGHALGPAVRVSRMAVVDCEHLSVGERTWVAALGHLSGDVELGADCSVNAGAAVRGRVRIGRAVRIGAHASLLGFDHGFADTTIEIFRQPLVTDGIVVGDDVWIGAHAIVRDGVRIGSHSVVGAGAVVTRDVPDWTIVVGNPARPVRSRLTGAGAPDLPARSRSLGTAVRDQAPAILAAAFVDGSFRDRPGAPATIRAHTDAVELADLWCDDVPAPWSAAEHVERLRAAQDPVTGLVDEIGVRSASVDVPGLPDQDRAYHVLAVGYALDLLGSRFTYPVRTIVELGAADLVHALDGLDWVGNTWGAGALVDAVGTALTWARLADPAGAPGLVETVVGWVSTRRDPGTGLWGPPGDGLRGLVNGGYRLVRGTLAQWGVSPAPVEPLVDCVLRRAGRLDRDATACDVLDVVHLLWWAARDKPGYRRDEVRAVAGAWVTRAADAWRADAGWCFGPGEPPSLRGTHLWSSAVWYAADLLDLAPALGYRPRGVHRPDPRWTSATVTRSHGR